MYRSILLAGFGGFAGSVLRFLISRYFQLNLPTAFPWGTFLVNIVGCFLIGLFYGMSVRGNMLSPDLRLFLMVGFCGGFTTFSTFSSESFTLLANKDFLNLFSYVGFSFVFGIVAVFLGRLIVK